MRTIPSSIKLDCELAGQDTCEGGRGGGGGGGGGEERGSFKFLP